MRHDLLASSKIFIRVGIDLIREGIETHIHPDNSVYPLRVGIDLIREGIETIQLFLLFEPFIHNVGIDLIREGIETTA